jgi:hypothetical protein
MPVINHGVFTFKPKVTGMMTKNLQVSLQKLAIS